MDQSAVKGTNGTRFDRCQLSREQPAHDWTSQLSKEQTAHVSTAVSCRGNDQHTIGPVSCQRNKQHTFRPLSAVEGTTSTLLDRCQLSVQGGGTRALGKAHKRSTQSGNQSEKQLKFLLLAFAARTHATGRVPWCACHASIDGSVHECTPPSLRPPDGARAHNYVHALNAWH